MTENFPKLISDTEPQNQEAQRMPSRINATALPQQKQQQQQKWPHKHVIFKLQKIKNKEKILRETIGNKVSPVEEQR